jgi:ABC-type amino acid transport substrate-binding protein
MPLLDLLKNLLVKLWSCLPAYARLSKGGGLVPLICVTLIFVIMSYSPPSQADDPEYRFVCATPKESSIGTFLWGIYGEAFVNLGKSFEMVFAPARRGRYMLDNHQVDGDCARHVPYIGGPGLTSLPVNLAYSDIYAISLPGQGREVTFENLTEQKRLGVDAGAYWIQMHLQDKLSTHQIVEFSGLDQGLKMLKGERLDAVLVLSAKYETLALIAPDFVKAGTFHVVPAHKKVAFSPVVRSDDAAFIERLSAELSRLLEEKGIKNGWSSSMLKGNSVDAEPLNRSN